MMKPQTALNVLHVMLGVMYAIIAACFILLALVFVPICGAIAAIMLIVETLMGFYRGFAAAFGIFATTYKSLFTSSIKTAREIEVFIDEAAAKIKRGDAKNVKYPERRVSDYEV